MSDENLEVPEYLRGQQTDHMQQALASAATASMSVPRISVRGRMFRFNEGGNEIRRKSEFIDAIILDVNPAANNMIKAWYEKGYQPGNTDPPDCASDDGLVPSPWVSKKQAPYCKQCPKNVFGSATSPNGKATKACRDSKRAWLIDQTDWSAVKVDGKPVVKEPVPFEKETIWGLNVSVSSLKSFSECGKHLITMGVAWPFAKVRITMVDAEFPQMEFKVIGWTPQTALPYVKDVTEKRPWAMFNTAALALPDQGSAAQTTRLPGAVMTADDVPAHIRAATGGAAPEMAGAQAGVKTGDVNDALSKF